MKIVDIDLNSMLQYCRILNSILQYCRLLLICTPYLWSVASVSWFLNSFWHDSSLT